MKNKKVEVKISLPLWVIILISFLLAVIGYSMVVAKHGTYFSLFFAAIVFVFSFVFIPFLPLFFILWNLRRKRW